MECPPGCPARIYDLMKQCWNWEPNERPSFHDIHFAMEHMFQESSITEGTFHDIHFTMEHMFQESSITEGIFHDIHFAMEHMFQESSITEGTVGFFYLFF